MRMSVKECLTCWRKALVASLGTKAAKIAEGRMRALITQAKQAEDAGRIADMQPLFAVPNLDNPLVNEGWFFLEIRYHPVVDGVKGARVSEVVAVLTPNDTPDRPDERYSLVELMFAG